MNSNDFSDDLCFDEQELAGIDKLSQLEVPESPAPSFTNAKKKKTSCIN